MARTIAAIHQSLIDAKQSEPTLDELNSSSKLAVWRLLLYVVAVGMWTLENLFDAHKVEVKNIIAAEKPGRLLWYADMAKLYQHGRALVPGEDYYDNSALDDAAIEAERVVKFSSVAETESGLRIKIAGVSSGDLAPLPTAQFDGFKAYMAKIKYAGTNLDFVNSIADELRLSLKVYYDPLVLDALGQRLDGSNNEPVQQAVNDYLKNGIDFNGFFVTTRLIDRLQLVEGVVNPVATLVQSKYGALPFTDIVDYRQPDAGYLRISPSNLALTFIPFS